MSGSADYLIIGGGLYGCATAYNLARRGAKNIVVLERKQVCAGGTAKSCAIIRTHYSVATNLMHAVASLRIFADFDQRVGGQVGFHRTGYLIVGPEEHRGPMLEVFHTQNEHGIDTAVLTPAEAQKIHPLLSFHDVDVIGYDTQTGFADPYLTTMAYAQRARDLGVTIVTDAPVTGLQLGGGVKTVSTPGGDLGATVAGGVAHRDGISHGAARGEVLARFLLDPFAEFPVALYGLGGLSAMVDPFEHTRPRVVVGLGIESRVRNRRAVAAELSLGGGVRLGALIRRGRRFGR